ncbi:putative membrane protein YeiB [Microbacterium sp. AG790]|uniref:heparan-alpha-glucosaminide N-acetyltransferase domain-containing protein n=1 Tax=Microbacterium sp. AG790 TaxID=2183995 RepID=UPI000EB3176E|nr:heparan-alpha-glucosaminide N-acetyltransferase domain-containing protein [Microbacterium sp. AG790]RKS93017.1 putative membrane protein YeiB [Microbacterium sp. AG790]
MSAAVGQEAPRTRPAGLRARWAAFGRAPRIVGVDVARALAVFGMIGVHVGLAGAVDPDGSLGWPALLEGRSSILFAVVAGISVALATGGAARPEGDAVRSARLRLAGRAIAVLAIGLVLELLGTQIAVILPVYGVLFLLVIPFVGMTTRTLVTVAAALAVVGPTSVAFVTAVTGATGASAGAGVQFLLTGAYPLTVWMPLILAGLAVGRSDLRRTRTAVVALVSGAALSVVGYGLGALVAADPTAWLTPFLPGGSFSSSASLPGGSSAVMSSMSGLSGGPGMPGLRGALDVPTALAQAWAVSPHSGGTLEIVGSGGVALLVVGACVLAGRRFRAVLVPLAAVGSMPLTAYAAHVLSFAVLVSPLAVAPTVMGVDGGGSLWFWLAFVAALLVGCTLWALRAGRGPLERLTAWAAAAADRPSRTSTTW